MTTHRAPLSVTPFVKAFAAEISPQAPVFIRITPSPDAKPLDCFYNVKREIERSGGRMQYGWALWEWPKVFIEAELHAVHAPADGSPWRDITPSEDPEIKRRLFVPDDTVSYDFDNEGVTLDNVRKAYVADPLIESFLQLSREMTEFKNAIPGLGVSG